MGDPLADGVVNQLAAQVAQVLVLHLVEDRRALAYIDRQIGTLIEGLRSLDRLNYPSYEVILVDDGSTDETQSLVQDFIREREAGAGAVPPFKNILQENRGLSAARNAGIAAARGEVVAFTDADCRADSDWLRHLCWTLSSGEFAAAGGPNLPPPAELLHPGPRLGLHHHVGGLRRHGQLRDRDDAFCQHQQVVTVDRLDLRRQHRIEAPQRGAQPQEYDPHDLISPRRGVRLKKSGSKPNVLLLLAIG